MLGVNILGKFLSNRDNNIRYVALNTLIKVVAVEPNAVQRHRNTILDCLRDPDISIRRRALDLSFTLINADNVRVLIRELLAFLEVADNEFKPAMTSQIGIAADRFAPNKRWHVDTMLRVLKLVSAPKYATVHVSRTHTQYAGRKLRQGTDSVIICPLDRYNPGSPDLLCPKAVCQPEGRHHARRPHSGRRVGDWRVWRCSASWWPV